MKIPFSFVAGLCGWLGLSAAYAAVPVVSNVTSQQRVGTKLVDISYNVADADGDLLKIRIEFSDDAGVTYSVPATSLTGAIGENIAPGNGKQIVWNAGVDWDGEYSDQMRVKIIASDAKGLPGLEWGNEIAPGGFLMGQDGGLEGSGPSRHVNIPWSFWLSKYEIRNDQYCDYLNFALAAGKVVRNGSTEVNSAVQVFAGAPVNSLLLNIGDSSDIRWNVSKFEVVGGLNDRPVTVTWYGAIAFAIYYGYDLPTTAEWEKAARGPNNDDEGEHLVYPWGNSITGGYANYASSGDPFTSKSPVGYYNGNQTPFGPNTANGYGLYDVIGNLAEWTRSINSSIETYSQQESLAASQNILANVSSSRVARGGGYNDYSSGVALKLYYRDTGGLTSYYPTIGFRVIRRSTP